MLLVARNEHQLQAVITEIGTVVRSARIEAAPADLTIDEHITALADRLTDSFGRLDILVHSAGVYARGALEAAAIGDLDEQYRTNLRAPYRLTQVLVPHLKAAKGDIVFINSSQGLTAGPGIGQFAATQHGLRALADSLRGEVNAAGVRVLTLHLGRTATHRQERIFSLEGRAYTPERLIQPMDVAAVVLAALTVPRTAEITTIAIRPMCAPV
jgi:NADP-dependent 3-hydroxy acid dehydrogenase YdfG